MNTHSNYNAQNGAALVVGLILLVVLTLMAISSMNSASLDLIMAGNEQYHARAFNAAETGIAQAFANGVLNTSTNTTLAATQTGVGSDSYQYTIQPDLSGNLQGPPPGYDSTYQATYFTINAPGASERNSRATNTQGLYVLVQVSSNGDTGNNGPCQGSTSLTGASTC